MRILLDDFVAGRSNEVNIGVILLGNSWRMSQGVPRNDVTPTNSYIFMTGGSLFESGLFIGKPVKVLVNLVKMAVERCRN